jgi:hypothetical protein
VNSRWRDRNRVRETHGFDVAAVTPLGGVGGRECAEGRDDGEGGGDEELRGHHFFSFRLWKLREKQWGWWWRWKGKEDERERGVRGSELWLAVDKVRHLMNEFILYYASFATPRTGILGLRLGGWFQHRFGEAA